VDRACALLMILHDTLRESLMELREDRGQFGTTPDLSSFCARPCKMRSNIDATGLDFYSIKQSAIGTEKYFAKMGGS